MGSVQPIVKSELREWSGVGHLVQEMRALERGDLRARLSTVPPAKGLTSETGPARSRPVEALPEPKSICQRLHEIALELQALSLSLDVPSAAPVQLGHPDLAELTPREREVLAHLVSGERVPSIAKRLFISQHTVRGHLKSIFRKVGVESQSDLIQYVRSLA
ncbi:MAG: helix-turn-helix transcriptional regulator [Myxococcota bacterium]|nr:helix-turn-helix transcriptional regulator [Myxococcota bacterium]